MNRLARASIAITLCYVSTGLFAQTKYPEDLFAVSLLHFDAVRAPHGPDWILKSQEAKAIIGSISAAMGINPTYVALAIDAIPTAAVQGEQTDYRVPVKSGYAYCATRIDVTSIAPAEGARASLINAAVNPGELQMTTWTPIQNPGGGKSWAEGDVQVYGIKPAYLDEFIGKGVCKKVTEQVGILSCRGKNACGLGVTHGNPPATGPSTPDLTK